MCSEYLEHGALVTRRQVKEAVPGQKSVEALSKRHGAHVRHMPRGCGIPLTAQSDHVRRGIDARVMDANRLEFPDASVDAIIGRAILHHLDYEQAVREVHRVLRPGGTAIFMEPLRDNPAWKLFRSLTPKARTREELPLSRQQIEWSDHLFGRHRHCFVGLVSTGLGALTSFLPLGADNMALRAADRADRMIERTWLRYWMRQAVLVWEKS